MSLSEDEDNSSEDGDDDDCLLPPAASLPCYREHDPVQLPATSHERSLKRQMITNKEVVTGDLQRVHTYVPRDELTCSRE